MPRRRYQERHGQPYLWLEPEEFDSKGVRQRRATWVIRDGSKKIRTRCSAEEIERANKALGEYLTQKYGKPSRRRDGDPTQTPVSEVLSIYVDDVVPTHGRPDETKQRIATLSGFWKEYFLADVNGQRCREYVTWRTGQQRRSAKPEKTGRPARPITVAMARRELEDLRAAINHHREEGYHREIIHVVLPDKPAPRDSNMVLTRREAARLLRAAWRARQKMPGTITARATGRHIARFILLGLYTGSRSGAICGAALQPAIGRGWIDLESGIFHRLARGKKKTKKRQPPCRLPDRLLAHLRRWERLGIARNAVIEWNGKPVKSVRKGFAAAVAAAGLDPAVIPHSLRHSAATWAMQRGVELSRAAEFLGMSEQVLRDVYYHHHPEYQREAASKLGQSPSRSIRLVQQGQPGQNRDKINVNKR